MQKNEDDILENWILYHGYLFGYENIYIIDNMSDSKSHEIYKKFNINVTQYEDYRKKGDAIFELMSTIKDTVFFIPLDLDEFIYLDTSKNYKNEEEMIRNYKEDVLKYIMSLKRIKNNGRYSFKYYLTSINNKLYYKDPILELHNFRIDDLGSHNKKFFKASEITGLDHGNHYGFVKDKTMKYTETELILIHYHFRGILKLIQKCRNDILGLKYIKSINNIEELKGAVRRNVNGSHNIKTYIKFYLNGAYSLIENNNESIELYFMINYIIYFIYRI